MMRSPKEVADKARHCDHLMLELALTVTEIVETVLGLTVEVAGLLCDVVVNLRRLFLAALVNLTRRLGRLATHLSAASPTSLSSLLRVKGSAAPAAAPTAKAKAPATSSCRSNSDTICCDSTSP